MNSLFYIKQLSTCESNCIWLIKNNSSFSRPNIDLVKKKIQLKVYSIFFRNNTCTKNPKKLRKYMIWVKNYLSILLIAAFFVIKFLRHYLIADGIIIYEINKNPVEYSKERKVLGSKLLLLEVWIFEFRSKVNWAYSEELSILNKSVECI